MTAITTGIFAGETAGVLAGIFDGSLLDTAALTEAFSGAFTGAFAGFTDLTAATGAAGFESDLNCFLEVTTAADFGLGFATDFFATTLTTGRFTTGRGMDAADFFALFLAALLPAPFKAGFTALLATGFFTAFTGGRAGFDLPDFFAFALLAARSDFFSFEGFFFDAFATQYPSFIS